MRIELLALDPASLTEACALPEPAQADPQTLTLALALTRSRMRHPMSGTAVAGTFPRPASRVDRVRVAAADERPITLTF